MKANVMVTVLMVCAWAGVSSSHAQQPPTLPAPEPHPSATLQQRFPVRVMEGVLENAVQKGAFAVGAEMRQLSPDVALFSGPAKARGFQLEGYGVFFAVDVPALHRSVTWSVRTLSQSNGDLTRAMQSIRRVVQNQNDVRMKAELEQALRLVELQVGPSGSARATNAGAVVTRPASIQNGAPAAANLPVTPDTVAADVMSNPSAAYTEAVQQALVDAMLDYGPTLNLGNSEWLTVAARENSDTLLAGDLSETVTVTLRVKASDLGAFKAGQLTKAEARARVEVRAF